ncbi:nitroreductase [Mobilisporobacter senegalensis]|uniref:Nitroreductase n=1 Tax=Mobilisporobacter senegalensis TaxID=1329262 RepID=A0A3N1XGK5_9FIRM|nr:nitroreductase family protein [Mobilisporobacter senegalensis]ROR25853.1 nitroreductase [Mobilisporobacter senegalensis]
MNETIMNIKKRRSTRVFLPEQIPAEELDIIIDAGLSAPSGHNRQSWHFTVVQNKELLNELSNETKQVGKNIDDAFVQQLANNEKFHVFYDAPTVVVVSGDINGFMPETDCAAATQNMLIAAESLGVASCWVGYITYLLSSDKGKEYKRQLGIPADHIPYYAVALGKSRTNRGNAPVKRENTVNFIK